ncbi:hypothetical protein [Streptomyces melanogenes]|uniref:hypothetical protein n=1 Tax=Streptomyces melanogenes TaxID=67326 RepID=UPI00167D3E27|nr:hypothetical protein [Streptomyces melanogenes]GGP90004.1 hypothetical protein GCM10010278_80540 [Streptomyces melanogenes]
MSLDAQQQMAEVRIHDSLNCAAYDPARSRILVGSAVGVVALYLDLTHSERDRRLWLSRLR